MKGKFKFVGDDVLGVPSKTQRIFINNGRIISYPTDKISKFSPNSVGTGVPDGPKNNVRSKSLPYR